MEVYIIFEAIYLQVETFIAKSFRMEGINLDNFKGLCIFREAHKGSLEGNSDFQGLKKISKGFKVSSRSRISIHVLLAFSKVFLFAQSFIFISMDNSNVVNSVDKVQVNLRRYLRNVSEESVGALSYIPQRVSHIRYLCTFFYNKIEEMS